MLGLDQRDTPLALPLIQPSSPMYRHPITRTTPLLLLGLFLLVGCDANGIATDAPSDAMTATGPTASAHVAAVYEAELRPLNPSVNGQGVTGRAVFTVGTDGDLTVEVDARGLAVASPLGIHAQHIHGGPECPTRADDANGDRIVDVIEGVPVYGPILVPLDGDLADLGSQVDTFPAATSRKGRSAFGEIDYAATASVTALDEALMQAGFDDGLALGTRHIVVHGVAASTELPETVQTLGGLPAQVTLPVACGEIRRVQ